MLRCVQYCWVEFIAKKINLILCYTPSGSRQVDININLETQSVDSNRLENDQRDVIFSKSNVYVIPVEPPPKYQKSSMRK